MPITEAVGISDFGPKRKDSGVLIKLLDSAERLGIQVHPTPDFSRKYFGTDYGKTECWHILGTREDLDSAIYIGFKKGISREHWKELFEKQDIEGMLSCLHRFEVKVGDTVLVKAGTPHAIGAGCFLLEIQEPTDYTMRVEKVTLRGETLTSKQIHYGVGEDALLECFIYDGISEDEARARYFKQPRPAVDGYTSLIEYTDTPCFALGIADIGCVLSPNSFITLVILADGEVGCNGEICSVKRSDKLFIPYGSGDISINCKAIVCYPPKV